jgi:hypothetical protein
MPKAGVVVLSASFDPGWTARVDGRPATVFPVAPALVATSVPAGMHRVTFRYAGFPGYWFLFLLSGLSIAVLAVIDRRARASRSGPWHGSEHLAAELNSESLGANERIAVSEGAQGVLRAIDEQEKTGVLVGASSERD